MLNTLNSIFSPLKRPPIELLPNREIDLSASYTRHSTQKSVAG